MSNTTSIISYKWVIFWLILSIPVFSGIPFAIYTLVGSYRQKIAQDPRYLIQNICQTGSRKCALPTEYLAELLELSCDQPDHLYQISLEEKTALLQKSPLIQSASVAIMPPDTLYIDYEVHVPIFQWIERENTGIDIQGRLLPLQPFFLKDDLPKLSLGSAPDAIYFGGILTSKEAALALKIYQILQGKPASLQLKKIDVRRAFAPHYGRREIVLFIDDVVEKQGAKAVFPKILRFSPKNFSQQLGNFFVLREKMRSDYYKQIELEEGQDLVVFSPQIIDFRIDELAFIQEHGKR